MGLGRAVLAGVAGGTAGAALMLPIFAGGERLGLLRQSPPFRVIDQAAETAAEATETGHPVAADERTAVAVGGHLLYGAAFGALFGLIREERRLPATATGAAYGLVLWAAGYAGWLPATGILPPPWRQRAGDALVPVAAHLVYGLCLGRVAAAIRGS